MSAPHPACPITADVAWRLRIAGAEIEGTGLESGLGALWDAVLQRAEHGLLELSPEAAVPESERTRYQVAIATEPAQHLALARLREWTAGPEGARLLKLLAQAHVRVLLASERWIQKDPAPEAESYTPLLLAGFIDDVGAMERALKPSRH